MSPFSSIRLLWCSLTLCVFAHAAVAQSGTPPAAHTHTHEAQAAPATYPQSVSRAEDLIAALERALAADAKGTGPAADSAFELAAIGRTLGRLALADQSVPRDKVKPINLAGKAIAEAAEALHESVDASPAKLDAARASLAALKPLIAELAALSPPDPYICEMRCEGKKSYDQPGVCPICKMELIRQSRAPFAVQVSAASDGAQIVAGNPVGLDIRLLDSAGNPVGAVDIVHEYPVHFMVFSEDLSFYAHEHPTRTPDGVFHLSSITFPYGGRFIAFADFTTSSINRIARTEFTVPAGATPAHTPQAFKENEDDVIKDGPYELRIRCNAGKFIAKQDSYIRYGVDINNEPVADLEPLMGAMGHLVIISADARRYIHSHPLTGPIPAAASVFSNGKPSDVVFHAVFPEPGLYRAFAQFRHKGRVIVSAVTIDAKAPVEGAAPAATHVHPQK